MTRGRFWMEPAATFSSDAPWKASLSPNSAAPALMWVISVPTISPAVAIQHCQQQRSQMSPLPPHVLCFEESLWFQVAARSVWHKGWQSKL